MAIRVEEPVTTPQDVLALESRGPWEDVLGAQSIYELIEGAARKSPDAFALTFLESGHPDEEPRRFSYKQLLGHITQAANLFHTLGVGPDDVVSFLLPNLPQTQFTMWGAATAGIVNPINFLLSSEQITDLLKAARTKVLVALGPHPMLDIWSKIEAVRSAVPELVAVLQVGPGDKAAGVLCFDEELARQPADHLISGRKPSREDRSIYFHTGGTTGSPKLAPHTHGNDIYCTWAVANLWNKTADSIHFHLLPMFHVAGSIVGSLAPFATGGEIVTVTPVGLRHPVALANHWKLVEKYKPTHLGGVPTNLVALMDVPLEGADISSIKHTLTGGSAPPMELERAWKKTFGIQLTQMYGMTESGSALVITPVEGKSKIGSAGIRIPYGQWKIATLGPDGLPQRECGPNENGAILFKSPGVFSGYLDAEQNQGTLTEDGWLITGDLGYIDDDQYLFITGRAKDMIIRSAHNIDPAIIEEALVKHPAVALAAAVGKPDPYAGEIPVAYVQLKSGEEASEEGLLEFLSSHISERPALPKEVIIVESLPVTGVGKIFKPELRWRQTRRVFAKELTALANENLSIEVEVGEDRRLGTLALIKITDSAVDRAAIEENISSLLGRFTIAHRVEWT